MRTSDTYKTITKPSKETLFKEKHSKFFSYAFPIKNEEDVKIALESLRKQHSSAGHFCYAYQIGTQTDKIKYRANDDGEPNNSAGMPIYGQIQSYAVTNILIVVVRYFGGVKLGVGGLISAYRTGAQMALDGSNIKTKTINVLYLISFEYKNMNKVMRIIKEKNLNIVDQKLELDCKITISVRQKEASKVETSFNSIYEVSVKELED
ncbi:YigZ family protein [Bizionia gelidisalsuginis]|uniref:YigZ family protein n=2 Tax=Bizionia TaxID=283785 RepID=A0A8H2LFW7_9FLAO|nr:MULTISPECIES: YigZ family protein [Bizionia]TYB77388.1 YigZ family protein [Bizionia saleffrena]TYC17930.1 YigZ family protein [Bizionia gelidisalsuginis]